MGPQEQVDALVAFQGGHDVERELLEIPVRAVRAFRAAHAHVSDVYEVELENGPCAYFKPTNSDRSGVLRAMANYGHSRLSVTISECAAWQLARSLGAPWEELVAPTVLRFIDLPEGGREPGALSLAVPGEAGRRGFFDLVPEQAEAGAFFDTLVGQQDRNPGNILWGEGERRIHLIDHGFSFSRPGDATGELALAMWRWQRHRRELKDAARRALRDLIESHLYGLNRFVEPSRAVALAHRADRMLADGRLLSPGVL